MPALEQDGAVARRVVEREIGAFLPPDPFALGKTHREAVAANHRRAVYLRHAWIGAHNVLRGDRHADEQKAGAEQPWNEVEPAHGGALAERIDNAKRVVDDEIVLHVLGVDRPRPARQSNSEHQSIIE